MIKLEEVDIQNDANTVKVLQEEERCKSGHYSVSSKKRVRTLNSLTGLDDVAVDGEEVIK